MANFLKYGLMAGLLYSAYAFILQLTGSDLRFNSSLSFGVMMIVPIIFMVMAVKADRNQQEGLISFGEGLKTSFLTYLIFIIIAIIVGQLIIQMYSPEDWDRMVELQKDMMSGMFGALGMDQIQVDEELEKITAQSIKDQVTGVGGLMMGVVTYAIVGLIMSLIVSAIMKKNPTP